MKRRLNDVNAARQAFFDAGQKAVREIFPVENEAGSLDVENLHYTGGDHTKADEKSTMHSRGTLARDLRGDMVLRDAEGNEIDRRSRRIIRVPHMTGRGTFIYGGNDYAIPSQGVLRPGVYSRMGDTGKPQAPIQTDGGPNMKLQYEPSSGEFRLRVHGAQLKLYPLLHAAGLSDEEIASHIGEAALKANKSRVDSRALSRVADKITDSTDTEDLGRRLRETFSGYGLDPDITEVTLGERHESVNPEMLAQTAGHLLRLFRGEEDTSDRDAIYAQPLRTPEIQLADQIRNGQFKLNRRLWKAINKGSLDAVPAGVLDDSAKAVMYEVGLAKPLEEYNPLEARDEMQRITRGGKGGLSGHAIPEEARVIHPSELGFLDPTRTSESTSIGLDTRAATDTYVDENGELYTLMESARTGETDTVAAKDVRDLTISWPDQRGKEEPFAVVGGRKLQHVKADDVDYYLPSAESLHSELAALSPMITSANGQRALMSAKYALQALPMTTAEEPLVQVATSAGDTMEQRLGRHAGVETAPVGGEVREVTDDAVVIEDEKGQQHTVELYNRFPMNRKTVYNQQPVVEAGDQVDAGQMVARSNFTSDRGVLQLGSNLRTAFLPRGETFEDAVLVSDRAAREKLSASLLKQREVDTRGDTEVGRRGYVSEFPTKYEKEQLAKLDDEGVVQVGQRVSKDDPLVLAVGRPAKGSKYYDLRKTKPKAIDESVTWDEPTEGEVVDVARTDDGIKVYVNTEKPAVQGDKWGARYGAKGIMTVIPEEDMPRGEDGEPFDMVISSLAITSRGNPGLQTEGLLGKLARHTGETVKMPLAASDDEAEGFRDEAVRRLKEEGLSPTEKVYDPKAGRYIPEVKTGTIYGYRLTHTAKGKSRARGIEEHTGEGTPATGGSTGGKKIGRQPMNALLSYGALDVIQEAQNLKGAANPEVWNALREGKDIKMPDVPYANRKLFDLLRGAGIDVKTQGTNLHIMPLRDSEVEEMSKGAVESSDMLDRQTMRPVPGSKGLFDPALTGGPGGSRWTHLDLPTPVPNPVMQRPIAHLLQIPQKGVREVIAGEREVEGKTGPGAIAEALGRINVDRAIGRIEADLSQLSKTAKDKAIKRLRHLKMLRKYDIDPKDLMITKVPVLPPKARPISELPGLEAPVMESSNLLYKDLIDLRNAMRETDLPAEDLGPFRGKLYDAVQAVYGLGEPVTQKSRQKGLGGILKTVFGDGPKHSYLQQHVLSKAQNMSGLAVISPNNDLSLNEVGLPRSLAWDSYEPLIVRRLVQKGRSPVAAMREVRKKSDEANEALEEVASERPLIVNRAPTLHRTGMMALRPRLHDGETLEVPPPLADTLGGDFDGDSGRFILQIAISLTGGNDVEYDGHVVKWKSFKGRNLSMPFRSEDGVASARGPVAIDDIPVLEGSRKVTEDGTIVYDVPDGVKVVSIDPKMGEVGWKPVTKLTVHPNLQMRNVTLGTRSKSTVNVSVDDSLIVYDEGKIVARQPDGSEGMMVPQVKGVDGGNRRSIELSGSYFSHIESMDVPLNEDVGFFFGLMAGNGWVDTNPLTYISNSRLSVFERVKNITDLPNNAKDTNYERVNINGDKKPAGKIQVGLPAWLSRALSQWFGHGSGEKRLPSECFFAPTEHLLGILDGLWSSDGSISINRSKSKPQLLVNYSTTSPYLKDQLIYICRLLGINATSSDATNNEGVCYYMVSLSSVDVKRLVEEDGFSITAEDKQAKLEEGIQYVDPGSKSSASMDCVPYPRHLHQYILDINRSEELVTSTGPSCRKRKGYTSRQWMDRFLPHLQLIDDNEVQDYCRLVENKRITWKPIKSVKDAGEATAYDITVPDTWTFANAEGIFMQDTMLFHVPITPEAVKDAEEKMLPSRNLLSPRDARTIFNPSKEVALGLWLATRDNDKKQPVDFATAEDALRAMRRGEVDPDQRVRIAQ